jgi:hypothetical protein
VTELRIDGDGSGSLEHALSGEKADGSEIVTIRTKDQDHAALAIGYIDSVVLVDGDGGWSAQAKLRSAGDAKRIFALGLEDVYGGPLRIGNDEALAGIGGHASRRHEDPLATIGESDDAVAKVSGDGVSFNGLGCVRRRLEILNDRLDRVEIHEGRGGANSRCVGRIR